jgi:predicted small lipoprotein YifL
MLAVALFMILAVTIAACGRKPAHLPPPADEPRQQFPRTYPTS